MSPLFSASREEVTKDVMALYTFRWEGFTSVDDLTHHIVGGILMGFGGVTALRNVTVFWATNRPTPTPSAAPSSATTADSTSKPKLTARAVNFHVVK